MIIKMRWCSHAADRYIHEAILYWKTHQKVFSSSLGLARYTPSIHGFHSSGDGRNGPSIVDGGPSLRVG